MVSQPTRVQHICNVGATVLHRSDKNYMWSCIVLSNNFFFNLAVKEGEMDPWKTFTNQNFEQKIDYGNVSCRGKEEICEMGLIVQLLSHSISGFLSKFGQSY